MSTHDHIKTGTFKICKICKNEFYVYKHRISTRIYCSKQCRYSDTELSQRISAKNTGKKRSPEVIEKIKQRLRENPRPHPSKTCKDFGDRVRSGILKRPAEQRKRTEQQKRRHSELLSGRKAAIEHVQSRADALIGRPQTAEATKKGITNTKSKEWAFRDATGHVYFFKNLREFVESHPSLFDPKDLVQLEYKRYSQRVVNSERMYISNCNAVKRLQEVGSGVFGSWKGWTKYSVLEDEYNNGNDLLARNTSPLE